MKLALPLATLILNLDRDIDRWAHAMAQVSDRPELDARRVPGVLGAYLPRVACQRLRQPNKAGGFPNLGVFLGHAAIWELVAQGPDWALVLEDDFILSDPGLLAELDLPEGAEMVFLNQGCDPFRDAPPPGPLVAYPLRTTVERMNRQDHPVPPGAYGYLLHPRGAAKLLDVVGREGFKGHVDWRMFLYGLTEADHAALGAPWALQARANAGAFTPGLLQSYAVSPAPIGHAEFQSTRLRADGAH